MPDDASGALEQVRAGAGLHLARVARELDAGANSPSTLPPNPPPITRAPAAPASCIRATARSTAAVETS